jgi:hypothetical protein
VVDQVPERIAHTVYLETCAPRDGGSTAAIAPLVIWLLGKHRPTVMAGESIRQVPSG